MTTKSAGYVLDQFQQPGPQHFEIVNVGGESGLVGNRLGLAIGHDEPVVDAVSEPPVMFARIAEQLFERFNGQVTKLADGVDAEPIKGFAGDFADAPDP